MTDVKGIYTNYGEPMQASLRRLGPGFLTRQSAAVSLLLHFRISRDLVAFVLPCYYSIVGNY